MLHFEVKPSEISFFLFVFFFKCTIAPLWSLVIWRGVYCCHVLSCSAGKPLLFVPPCALQTNRVSWPVSVAACLSYTASHKIGEEKWESGWLLLSDSSHGFCADSGFSFLLSWLVFLAFRLAFVCLRCGCGFLPLLTCLVILTCPDSRGVLNASWISWLKPDCHQNGSFNCHFYASLFPVFWWNRHHSRANLNNGQSRNILE